MTEKRENEQLSLPIGGRKGWGGWRQDAGRKKSRNAKVRHRSREPLPSRFPVHATLRVAPGLGTLRARRHFRHVARSLGEARERFGFRLVHFAVLANHLHLIVEADDARALGRGMKGLAVRLARAANRVEERSGKVFPERYHAHYLRTPSEAAHAVAYVLNNFRLHLARRGHGAHGDAPDFATSASPFAPEMARPRTWLLAAAAPSR